MLFEHPIGVSRKRASISQEALQISTWATDVRLLNTIYFNSNLIMLSVT